MHTVHYGWPHAHHARARARCALRKKREKATQQTTLTKLAAAWRGAPHHLCASSCQHRLPKTAWDGWFFSRLTTSDTNSTADTALTFKQAGWEDRKGSSPFSWTSAAYFSTCDEQHGYIALAPVQAWSLYIPHIIPWRMYYSGLPRRRALARSPAYRWRRRQAGGLCICAYHHL